MTQPPRRARTSAPALSTDQGDAGSSSPATPPEPVIDALRRSESVLAQAGKMAHLGAWEIKVGDRADLSANPLWWSDETYRIFGYEPGGVEVTNDLFFAHVHPEDRALVSEAVARAIAHRTDYTIEHRIVRPDGTARIVLEHARITFDERGQPRHIVGAVQDVTERRRAEHALRESEAHYRYLFENMLNGFAYCRMLYDEEGRPDDFVYLDVNDAFYTMTGLEGVTQRRVSEVIPGLRESDPDLFEIYGRVASTGRPERFEMNVTALNMWFSVSVYSPSQDHFVALFDVITERKQAEMEKEGVAEVLHLLNVSTDRRDLMKSVLSFLQRWTGLRAVGIRLRDGDDYPYYETTGFPEDFVRLETYLCSHDAEGNVVRDCIGHPILDCMCGNILQRRFDPGRPYFTSNGSFWTNNTSELLATTTEADRRARTRNRCNREGYESVALIPLCSAGQTFGLIQFNDPRPGRFTPELITLFERLAHNIAHFLARKDIEEKLLESEARYRDIFENSPIAIWEEDFSAVKDRLDHLRHSGVTDFRAHLESNPAEVAHLASLVRIVRTNRMSRKVMGLERVEDPSHDLPRYFVEDSLPVFREEMIVLANGGLQFDGESPIRTAGGELRHFSLSLSVPRGREESLSRVLVSFSDISERKRAEEQLRRAHDQLSLAQRSSGAGTWEWDLTTGKVDWSPELFRLFGLPEDGTEATFDLWRSTVHPQDLQAAEDTIEESIRLRMPLTNEYRILTASGQERWISALGDTIYGEGGAALRMSGLCLDISERKRMERELRDLNDRLEHRVAERTAELEVAYETLERRAEQLRALASELARAEDRERRRLAQVLHDHLQQLLVAAKFNTATIRRRIDDPDLKVAAQQVVDILDQSIAASRSLTMELSPPVLHDAGLPAGLEWLARWMEEHHGLAVEVTSTAPTGPISEDLRLLLFQAIRELLLNVVKHAETNHARVILEPAADGLRITVRDEGRGFDPVGAVSGIPGGFGLFNIRERLALLEGRFEITSAPEGGTMVVLEVPLTPTAKAATAVLAPRDTAQPRAADSTRPARQPVRVLVVDDHAVVRQGLVQLLRREQGLEIVEEAVDGLDAIEKARHLRPDVILMDVTMPRLSGIEATRHVTSEMPEIRIIGLSVHSQDDMAAQMRAAGAVRYLVKDSPIEEIAAVIREVAAGPA